MSTPKILAPSGRPADETPSIVSPTGEAVTSTPDAPQQLPAIKLEPFGPAKSPVGFTQHGQGFALHNKDGIILAFCNRPDVAGMFCEAMRLMYLAGAAMRQEHAEAAEKLG